jgi:homoserine O-acetyltransferase
MGRGKAFDPNRFFIICSNTLGSPYGSASPVTINPETGKSYGPEFPPTTIRDDVRYVRDYVYHPYFLHVFYSIHKLVLDSLGVRSVAVVIGGSMGGMAVLEWPLCTPPGFIRRIVPIATSARHSAWCISWGEAQRQSIYSDPTYQDGYYNSQPASGLAAARMSALLTYRSRDSFESRFGRKAQLSQTSKNGTLTPPASPKLSSHADDAVAVHNDGLKNARPRQTTLSDSSADHPPQKPSIFSAQSYLRYQGDKFTARFDANCYIHITRKLDTHDIARDRVVDVDEETSLAKVLATLPPRALVISIATDGLFTTSEQREIAAHVPQAELVVIPSPDGHDGFLLEFEQINTHILRYLKREFPDYYGQDVEEVVDGFAMKKTSVFGEAEVDITQW